MNGTMWTFVVLFFSFIASTLQDCTLQTNTYTTIRECYTDGKIISLDTSLINVPDKTICRLENEDEDYTMLCYNGKWLPKHREVVTSVVNHRIKRGWFSDRDCVFRIFICLWRRSGDGTPPTVYCPPPEIHTADPIQTNKRDVTWQTATAYDETDGSRPVTLRGKRNHSTFGEGDTRITYEAKDTSGNRGSCYFTITVNVFRCNPPTPIDNGYYICHPGVDLVQGTTCWFGCYEGFDFDRPIGSMTCQTNKEWSLPQPKCIPFECEPLPVIDGADLNCTNGRYFRSICVYKCKTGYDMPPAVSAALVCAINKQWRKHGEPECVDIEPPSFVSCPSIVIAGTDTGVSTSQIGWTEPLVQDNSNSTIVPKQIRGDPAGTKLPAGTYEIEYDAVDKGGNKANSCSFKVIVRDILCPRLYPTPYLKFTCPSGYRSGIPCNISCDYGKIIHGPDFVLCEKSIKGLYGQWNWNGAQTSCIDSTTCNAIQPPQNGAVACDNWTGGNFCQVQCRAGTDMANKNWKSLYTCGLNGDWIPTPVVQPCRQLKGKPITDLKIEAAYYFQGECSDAITKAEIQSNFVNALSTSIFFKTSACGTNGTECRAQDVQVFCGESKFQQRVRREVNDVPVNTNASLLTVTIDIVLISEDNTSMEAVITKYSEIYRTIKTEFSEITLFLNGGNVDVVLEAITNSGLVMKCEEGSVVTKESLSCVQCPEGSFFNTSTATCEHCPKGTFQINEGKLSCVECPKLTTTRLTGSTSEGNCEDACSSGMWSADGAYPCSLCETSTFSSSYGSEFCDRCPGSTSTLTTGSTDITDCKEFDVTFISGNTSEVNVILRNMTTVDDLYASYWIQMITTSVSSFAIRFRDQDQITVLLLQHTLQQINLNFSEHMNIFPAETMDSKWHFVKVQLIECNLTIYVDDAKIASVEISDTCNSLLFKSITFFADDTTSGKLTQFNMWSEQQYMSTAALRSCFKSEAGEIFSWQSVNEAEIEEAYIELSSCDDFDNCLSNPCLHGMCLDGMRTFFCDCSDGFTGVQCEKNIDNCLVNMCMNGGTCIDGVSSYTCSCPHTYTGIYCEIEMVHGHWGLWGNWSECSSTCGNGTKLRQRRCNNPAPDNGGQNCSGDSIEESECNLEECSFCPELVAPANGTMNCEIEGESYNCTISCDEGFEFDITPLDHYFCGPETFHEWSFETKENPLRRFPQCTKTQHPNQLAVEYSARYKDLTCTDDAKPLIRTQLDSVLGTIACVQNGTCEVSTINICEPVTRQKRNVDTASFSVTINTQQESLTDESKVYGLKDAFEHVHQSAEDGALTVANIYELDLNSTSGKGIVKCEPGYVQAYIYCVRCGIGSYVNSEQCERCDFGTYQDQEGQANCKSCPEGKSTLGMGSISVMDCTVEVAQDSTSEIVIGLVVGCVIGTVLLVAIIVAIIYRKIQTKVQSRLYELSKNGNVGPSKRKFNATSLTTV